MKKIANKVLQVFNNLSFRSKLIVSYLVLIIIPIIMLGVYSLRQAEDLLYSQLESSQSYNVTQMAFNLGSRLEKNNEFIRFTAFSPYLMDDFNSYEKNWYNISQKMNKYFEPVSWYTLSQSRDLKAMKIYFEYLDQPIGSFIEPSAGVADQEWYKRAEEYQATNWYFDGGEIYASRRIYNTAIASFIGVIRIRIDTPYLMGTLTQGSGNAQGFVLTGEDNNVLYANEFAWEVLAEQSDFLEVFDSVVHVGGEQYYVAKAGVAGYGWNIYSLVPIAEYTSRTNNIFAFMLAMIVVCLLVLLVLIALFSSSLVKRLAMLDSYMRNVEQGDYSIEISSISRDEVGRLTNSMGRMVVKTNQLINQVYKSEIDRKEEELKSLQSQINPHFLYNALSLINWNALDAGNEEISQIAGFLSTFYRTCLNKGQSLTTVANEIDNIKAYINIQQVMHSSSFDVIYDIDPEVLPATIVNFSLEPLVENAIMHGLDEKENFHGTLCIKAEVWGDCVRFIIIDDGIGMPPDVARDVLEKEGNGYGMYNVDKRTKLHFGEEYGITIESVPGSGTSVYLTIPQ